MTDYEATYAERKKIAESYPKLKDLNVSSKYGYLDWVEHWKRTYKTLARMIRDAKTEKRYHRDQARLMPEPTETRGWHRSKMMKAHWLAFGGRWRARDMMYWRMEGKKQSWISRCTALGENNLHASQEDLDVSQEDSAA